MRPRHHAQPRSVRPAGAAGGETGPAGPDGTPRPPSETEVKPSADGPVTFTVVSRIGPATVGFDRRPPVQVNPTVVLRNVERGVNHTVLARADGRHDLYLDTDLMLGDGGVELTDENMPRVADVSVALVAVVTSVSGASVFSDTDPAPWGGSPPTKMLAAGPHTIRVRAAGYREATRRIEVIGGVSQTVTMEPMVPDGGALGRALRGWRGPTAAALALAAAVAVGAWLGSDNGGDQR